MRRTKDGSTYARFVSYAVSTAFHLCGREAIEQWSKMNCFREIKMSGTVLRVPACDTTSSSDALEPLVSDRFGKTILSGSPAWIQIPLHGSNGQSPTPTFTNPRKASLPGSSSAIRSAHRKYQAATDSLLSTRLP